jgi:hypothetical protein
MRAAKPFEPPAQLFQRRDRCNHSPFNNLTANAAHVARPA